MASKTTGGFKSLSEISADVSQNLVDKSKYSVKSPTKMNPIGICIHNTANNASASNEISYMRSNNNTVSYHLAIDDKSAVQGLPYNRSAYHAGDGSGDGNRKHIGIEIAKSTDYGGDTFLRAEQRAAVVTAKLCQSFGFGISQIKAHRDFASKNCPHRTNMDTFKSMVKEAMSGKMPSAHDTKTGGETSKTVSGNVKVGSKVKVTGTRYATGQNIPGWVRNNTYTVSSVSGDRALLKEIMSWVKVKDLAVQGASTAPVSKQDTKPNTANTDKKTEGAQKTTGNTLEALLAKNPGVKTNQDLINLFYSMGGNNFNGAGAVATQYGMNINKLCANRNAKIAGAGKTSKPATKPASKPASKPAAGKTAYENLMAKHPEVKTNQDLINLFYSMGGGNFNGATAVANEYGIDINMLCNNRKKAVSRTGGVSNTAPAKSNKLNANQKLADNSQQVARELPGTGWCAKGVSMAVQRTYGIYPGGNGNQIGDRLPKKYFRYADVSLAEALRVPGVVLTWNTTPTPAGRKYGHTAITVGNGKSSTCDFYENNTLGNSGGRTGFRAFTTY